MALHDSQLVESAKVEPWMWRANCKVTCGFLTVWGLGTPAPASFKGQL